MKVFDQLYGEYELPEFVEELSGTDLCIRSRKLTLDSVPNSLLVRGPAPSRFEHGLGVAHLAGIVVDNNPELEPVRKELMAAALLHDAGNPPFSHLLEDLLEAHNGHRGESHMGKLLPGSSTEAVLRKYGIDTGLVINLITGNNKPLSAVLSGSMDIDNLDNLARYSHHVLGQKAAHDPERIAAVMRFSGVEWYINAESLELITQWRASRLAVYGWINGNEHAVACKMVYRAAEHAFLNGALSDDFFALGDVEALEYLRGVSPAAAYLLDTATAWNWYALRYIRLSANTELLPLHLKELARSWEERARFANELGRYLGIRPEQVCIGIAFGRDDRQVLLPVITSANERLIDTNPAEDVFRVRVYVDAAIEVDEKALALYLEKKFGVV